ncbi:3-keto-disaccharide hydrolase [Limnoglobus roseus]|uniref:Putative beta-jelly-roll-type glycoside hydrolase n=1 Tax=Limnoglobus roseus TaxID=2598579 RepID=A0A5C1A5M8_9BACT|nr:DUF1080 domain-containing protein [Limnoglobus roseus]QEL13627.1 putative beta-jelly-roll-type glycoside hydrolase [Limnoglobus roseus]
MTLVRLAAFLVGVSLLLSPTRGDDFKPDAGFTALFNGKDLTGWKKTKGGDSLDGKAEAYDKRFTVADGTLVIDPKVKGDVHIETQKVLPKDVHIRFEFKADAKCNNDLFLHGTKFDISKANVKELKEDTWQTLDVIVKANKAEFKLDGAMVKTIATKGEPTSFRIRAEFGGLVVRKLQMIEVK